SGLCEALQVPKFIPYLGRKSCPLALPVGATLIEAQTAAQALYQFGGPPSWLRRIASLPGEEVEVRTDQHSCSGFDPERLHLRRDRCIDPVQRLFVEREEIIARTKMPN
ncbi:MAG: hypothetical protein KDD55_09315, partial [Bdellovibrionales bacterium]|nr:hypothetical protein [Bdellovibrionales bacterium]